MSRIQRIVSPDQTVVVIEEHDYIGLLVFIDGNGGGEEFDHADAVVLFEASGANRLATALVEAVERKEAAACQPRQAI